MNEFNPSGGQSNIKLGDYIARRARRFWWNYYTRYFSSGWDGTRFTF